MATKKKTNTISALYKTIDQKQLSDQAKETLKKLRLATGNFRSKDERANEAFNTFYNKLLEKKPTAVKTTKEYKDMVRQRQVEHMKKIREARKEKEESKKGQGNDRDAARPAKPYGWRLRGKHNYRKPTLKQIRNGEAYYEGRVNRADVKRKKFPMLEKGGYMEHGGAIKNQYEGREPQDIWDSYTKEQKLHFLYDHHEEINEYKGISSEEENPWFNVSYKSNWANLDEDVKNRFANHVRGGQYAKGGYVDVKENLIKELGRLQRQLNSDRLRVFKEDGSTEEMERQRERASKKARFDDILKTLNEIESNEKMAKGGVVYTDLKDIPNLMDRVERGYVTYRGLGAFKEGTEITVDGKKYIVTDDDFNSIARDKDGNMRIRFSAPSRKRYEDGGYMAESGEVFYKESHKMGH
jgi:hypothetical protein